MKRTKSDKYTKHEAEEIAKGWADEFEREFPQVLYNGGIEPDEDPADYFSRGIKAVRLG